MTNEEIALAVASVPVEELPELISRIFDEIEAVHDTEELQEINDLLLREGVDVRGLCRKKHPA